MSGLNWAQWVLIGLTAFGAIFGVATVGKERKPRSAAEAAVGLVLNAAYIWLVIKAGA